MIDRLKNGAMEQYSKVFCDLIKNIVNEVLNERLAAKGSEKPVDETPEQLTLIPDEEPKVKHKRVCFAHGFEVKFMGREWRKYDKFSQFEEEITNKRVQNRKTDFLSNHDKYSDHQSAINSFRHQMEKFLKKHGSILQIEKVRRRTANGVVYEA